MELTINDKQYVFIFGYRFIKELNKKMKSQSVG
ncbi:hypothetical protein V425_09965 [Lactococcus lactis RTB018]|nr:hypothetical protein V425_09965 [Lactococcus lactis RTB018]